MIQLCAGLVPQSTILFGIFLSLFNKTCIVGAPYKLSLINN